MLTALINTPLVTMLGPYGVQSLANERVKLSHHQIINIWSPSNQITTRSLRQLSSILKEKAEGVIKTNQSQCGMCTIFEEMFWTDKWTNRWMD